jgi:hypothetical protein
MDYRSKIDFNVIKFPEGFDEENRLGCKEYCCTPLLKLADESENDSYKNDITGVVIKRSDLSDVVDFEIKDCEGNVLDNLGFEPTYPQDNLAIGFVFEWQQYLQTYGAGKYTISIVFTIAGVQGGFDYGNYELKPYSITNASKTVRVWSEPRSFNELENIDFTDSNHKDSIRFNGIFGERQPKTEINNLITKGRKVEKVTRENVNEYTLKTDPIDIKITRRLIDFHFLNEDKLLLTDHNPYNHNYLLFDVPVVVEEMDDVEYIEYHRFAKMTVKFGDRKKISKTYYNVE